MTIKENLLKLVKEKKLQQYAVDCILLEINSNKSIDDLTEYERKLINLYLKK